MAKLIGDDIDAFAPDGALTPERRLWLERLDRIVSIAGDAILAIDAEGHVLLFNDAAERAFGYSRAEVLGKHFELLIPERARAAHPEHIRSFLEAPGDDAHAAIRRLAVAGRRKGGEEFPAEASVSRLRIDDSWFIAVVMRDVTEGRLAQAELRRARDEAEKRAREAEWDRAMLRTLLDNAPEGISIAGGPPDFPIVANSRFAREVLGRSEESATGVPVGDHLSEFSILLPDGKEPLPEQSAMWRATHLGERVSNEEWKIRRADGTTITTLVDVAPIRTADGQIVGAVNCWRDITERLKSEADRAFQAGLLAQVHDAVVAVDAVLRITYWNRGAEEVFGWTAAEVLGKESAQVLPTRIPGWSRETATTTGRHDGEAEFVRKDGARITTHIRSAALRDAKGDLGGFVSTFRDITERRHAESELRQSQSMLKAFYDSSPFMIGVVELNGDEVITVLGNAAMAQAFNTAPEQLPNRSIRSLGPTAEEDRIWLDHFRDSQKNRQPARFEYQRPAPSNRWLSVTVTFLGEWSGRPRFSCWVEDITERRRIQDRLTADHAALELLHDVSARLVSQSVLATLQQGVVDAATAVTHSRSGTLHLFDSTTRSLLLAASRGFDAEYTRAVAVISEDARCPCAQALHRRDRVVVPDIRTAGFLRDSPALAALEAAEIRAVQSTTMMARDGRVLGVLSTHWSEVHEPDEVTLRMLDLLAREAADVIEHQQREEALARAVRARDEVLGIVAHDLRNPLSGMLLQAQLLKRNVGNGLQPTVEAIMNSGRRMNRLIQDMLDVARLEAGSLTINARRVETRKLVVDALESHRAPAEAADIELRLDASDSLPDVKADIDRLAQVFDNLIGNAIKFTPRSGVVTVKAVVRETDLLFQVSDTGAGIAADQLPHIFDRFWQARSTDRRGAGLGLSIVKGIVEAHLGRIWVESTVGVGTTLSFTMPLVRSAERVTAP